MCHIVVAQSQLENSTLLDMKQLIKTIPTKRLGDVRYSDLYQPANNCIGLYFLASPDGKQLYIGKSTSRCIAERIAAHIDGRANAYLNSFSKNVLIRQGKDITNHNINNILPNLFDWNLSVLFVAWQNESCAKQLISKIEGMLIFDLQPQNGGNCIHGTNRKKPISVNTPIKNLIL